MIPQTLMPRALRHAPVEEQLEYLLQRRKTIEQLLRSLERYARDSEGTLPERQGSGSAATAA